MAHLYQFFIREFQETAYGETMRPFESDLPFEWYDPEAPDIAGVIALLAHLGYDTEGAKFTPTGAVGLGVTGDHLDVVIGLTDDA